MFQFVKTLDKAWSAQIYDLTIGFLFLKCLIQQWNYNRYLTKEIYCKAAWIWRKLSWFKHKIICSMITPLLLNSCQQSNFFIIMQGYLGRVPNLAYFGLWSQTNMTYSDTCLGRTSSRTSFSVRNRQACGIQVKLTKISTIGILLKAWFIQDSSLFRVRFRWVSLAVPWYCFKIVPLVSRITHLYWIDIHLFQKQF